MLSIYPSPVGLLTHGCNLFVGRGKIKKERKRKRQLFQAGGAQTIDDRPKQTPKSRRLCRQRERDPFFSRAIRL